MRVTKVKKARRSPGNCSRCGTVIAVGDPYLWFKFRRGPKRIHCVMHYPKASELTTSDKLARLYAAQEELEAAIGRDAILEALDAAIMTAEEVGQEYEDSLRNMPDSLQGGTTGQEIQDKIDACEAWRSELESCKDSYENEDGLTDALLKEAQRAAGALEI